MTIKTYKYNIIIDFEAITSPWKVKARFYMQPVPYLMGIGMSYNGKQYKDAILFNAEKFFSKEVFLKYIKNKIFAFIKKTTNEKNKVDLRDIQFICFGDTLEKGILKQVFFKLPKIKDLSNTFDGPGLNFLVKKMKPKESPLLIEAIRETLVKNEFIIHRVFKNNKNYALGALASYLGWMYIVLDNAGSSNEKHFAKSLSKKEIVNAIKEYNLKDIDDIFYLINNEKKAIEVTTEINKVRKKISLAKRNLKKLSIIKEFLICNEITNISLNTIEKEINKVDSQIAILKKD